MIVVAWWRWRGGEVGERGRETFWRALEGTR